MGFFWGCSWMGGGGLAIGIGLVLGNRYDLEILHQCGNTVKTKSQKVFGVNS